MHYKDHTEKQLIYKTRPGYESRNSCNFSRFLKVKRHGAEVKSTGRSFHIREEGATSKTSRLPLTQMDLDLMLVGYCV